MKQQIIVLLSALVFLTSEVAAQHESIMDSSPVPKEQDEQFWREEGKGLDFAKASPGNYLLISQRHTREISQERAGIIKEILTNAVEMDQQGKTYLYTEPDDKFLIVRFNEPADPLNAETLVNVVQIVFIAPDEAPEGNAFVFAMNAEQGAKLLEKINSTLE